MFTDHAGALVGLLGFLVEVGPLVEVGEEEKEKDSVRENPQHDALREVAVDEEQLALVHHN